MVKKEGYVVSAQNLFLKNVCLTLTTGRVCMTSLNDKAHLSRVFLTLTLTQQHSPANLASYADQGIETSALTFRLVSD